MRLTCLALALATSAPSPSRTRCLCLQVPGLPVAIHLAMQTVSAPTLNLTPAWDNGTQFQRLPMAMSPVREHLY